MFSPSVVPISLSDKRQVVITQSTEYPNTGTIQITVTTRESAVFPMFIRIPRWAKEAAVTINGETQPISAVRAGILREWRDGDRVELSLGLTWRWIAGRGQQNGYAALARGPLVFCLNRERNRLGAEVELREITLDPDSASAPFADDVVRPGGIACRVRAWSAKANRSSEPDLSLILTEFADSGGEETYFRLARSDRMVRDELLE